MKKNNNSMLMIGGVAVLGYLLLSKKTTATTGTGITPGSTTSNNFTNLPGAPATPSVFDFGYYSTYQYPAMLKQNPNVGNPNYRLTDAEANQYMSNYLDIQQGLQLETQPGFTLQDAARRHWTNHGVAEKRSFLPFLPTDRTPFVPAPANANSSGGSSWITSALGIAGTVVGLLGVGDDVVLNDKEIEVLVNGSAVVTEMLPLFYRDPMSFAIEEKMNTLLKKYTA